MRLATLSHVRLEMPVCAVVIVHSLSVVNGLAVPLAAYAATFAIVWIVYLIDASPQVSPEDETGHPARYGFHRTHGPLMRRLVCGLVALTLGCAVMAAASVRTLPWWALPFAIPIALYFTPIIPGLGRLPKLKYLTRAKTLLVAVSWWAGAWAVASSWDTAFQLSMLASASSLALLLKIFVETLIRDMIDAVDDQRRGIRSMGQASRASMALALAGSLAVIGFVASSFPIGKAVAMSLLTIGMLAVAFNATWSDTPGQGPAWLDRLVIPWYAIY